MAEGHSAHLIAVFSARFHSLRTHCLESNDWACVHAHACASKGPRQLPSRSHAKRSVDPMEASAKLKDMSIMTASTCNGLHLIRDLLCFIGDMLGRGLTSRGKSSLREHKRQAYWQFSTVVGQPTNAYLTSNSLAVAHGESTQTTLRADLRESSKVNARCNVHGRSG